jgi:hypothetical protein
MTAHILQRPPLAGSAALAALWKRLRALLSRMAPGSGPASMELGAGQVLRLLDADGWSVASTRGSVWLTQEADARDVFLDTGDSFTLDRAGLALVLARRQSVVAIRPPERQDGAARWGPDSAAGGAREIWLKAVYPECGPWNDPAAYRKLGLL